MKENVRIATFGAGCFWSTQYKFDQIEGVIETEVGYMGGKIKDPTYDIVCSGKTGYIEVVKIKFNRNIISYENLLEIFFKIHDPTQYKRQGFDIGEQYSSAIFYHNDNQKEIALEYIKKLNSDNIYKDTIKTDIRKAEKFYKAEEYHQKYIEKLNKN